MRVLTTLLGFSRESLALKAGLSLRGGNAVQVPNGMEVDSLRPSTGAREPDASPGTGS
jgi:hypothetical protein